MIDVVNVLGTHSMRTGELKQLMGSLRPLENGELVSYINISMSNHNDCTPI